MPEDHGVANVAINGHGPANVAANGGAAERAPGQRLLGNAADGVQPLVNRANGRWSPGYEAAGGQPHADDEAQANGDANEQGPANMRVDGARAFHEHGIRGDDRRPSNKRRGGGRAGEAQG